MSRPYRLSDEGRAKRAERMKARNADPEFNPLAALNDAQRRVYNTLRRKDGTRDEALREAVRPHPQAEAAE